MIIETNRLLLRDFQLADTEPYCKLTADSKYQRFYSEEDCSPEKARQLVAMFVAQSEEAARSKYQLAITLKDRGDFIGTAGLRIEPQQQASIGCGVAREYQAAGFAEEAMSALLAFGFEQQSIHRVYAETIAENRAAIRLCKRFGMREEARLIDNRYFKGRWWSTVIMAMLKSEWANSTTAKATVSAAPVLCPNDSQAQYME